MKHSPGHSGAIVDGALPGLRGALARHGFKARGQRFHRVVDGGNTVHLALQRSMDSRAEETPVAINMGVYSAVIGLRTQAEPKAALDVWQSHWQGRAAFADGDDWLKVFPHTAVDECARSLGEAATASLPGLLAVSSDEALRDLWMSGVSPGLTDFKRLLNLAILLHAIGPREQLATVLTELRAKVAGGLHEALAEAELKIAGVSD